MDFQGLQVEAAPLVSVVMIAYNVEKTLARTMDSLVGQAMKEIEILCVDDGSTDATAEILQDYARRDGRIAVLRHEKNSGPIAARHTGIMRARGNYVLLVDAGDELTENACERLYREIERQKVDVLQFGTVLRPEPGTQPTKEQMQWIRENLLRVPDAALFQKAFRPGGLLKLCFEEKRFSYNVWNKIYRRDVLQQALSQCAGERVLMSEDLLLCFMVLCYAERYGVCDQPFYVYYVGGGMSTETCVTDRRIERAAEEYPVYLLAEKWAGNTSVSEAALRPALEAVRRLVRDSVLWNFLMLASPAQRKRAYPLLAQNYPTENLVEDLAQYVFQDHIFPPEKLAACLRGYPPFCDHSAIGTVKTVGMYYHRMYNGGTERVIAQLTPILQSLGYRVVVITREPENEKDYPLPDGTVRLCLNIGPGKSAERIEAFRRIIREQKIDAMIYHEPVAETLDCDCFAIKSMAIPLILYVHMLSCVPFEWGNVAWTNQRDRYALFDKVITINCVDLAWWQALGYDTVQVPNPLTFAPESTAPAALDGHSCLWCARLNEYQKQYWDAFEIARLVHAQVPDFCLDVVGTTETQEEMNRILAYIEQNDMGGYVRFYGFQGDVVPFYQRASVFLLTSSWESFGLTIMESKVCGLPMVAYELPNVDAIREPKGAMIVPQRDIHAAAECIVTLLKDDSLRRDMGRQARQSVEELYRDGLAPAWREIMDSLLEPRKEETPVSKLPPLETAVRCAMERVVIGMEKAAPTVVYTQGAVDPHAASIYSEGYINRVYNWINRLLPIGGRKRALVKRIAKLFLH